MEVGWWVGGWIDMDGKNGWFVNSAYIQHLVLSTLASVL